jgi:hypothetical protein
MQKRLGISKMRELMEAVRVGNTGIAIYSE